MRHHSGQNVDQILTTVMTYIALDKSTDNAKPHLLCFLPQYQRQRKFFSECEVERELKRELKMALGDILTCAALSVLLSTTAN